VILIDPPDILDSIKTWKGYLMELEALADKPRAIAQDTLTIREHIVQAKEMIATIERDSILHPGIWDSEA